MRCFFVKKIIIIVPILIIVFFIAFKNENKEIRVRVIPQDNSEEQYEIKQEVVKDLCGIFSIIIDDKMNYKETDSAIQANLDKIKACLEKYDCEITYDYYNFPVKAYNGNVIEETRCKTLLVLIGKARGDNWWGSIYPNLLGMSSEETITYRSYLLEMFGGE